MSFFLVSESQVLKYSLYVSRKILQDLKVTGTKPSLVNKQDVIFEFKCNSCHVNYILGYTSHHLHLRIEEHKINILSSANNYLKDQHDERPNNLQEQFAILKKCCRKFECLIYKMLLKREKDMTLNTQKDSIPAKLFTFCTSHFIPT